MTGWTIAMTGQRPKSLDHDYSYKSEMWQWIRAGITEQFEKIQPARIISGMALGVDTVAAEQALVLGIPFVAAVPFKGQEKSWSEEQQEHYWTLLGLAQEVEFVSEENSHGGIYQIRNEWMVDRSDLVLAVWTGFKGGTRNCIEYALKQQVPVYRLDPQTRKVGRYDGTKHIVKELAVSGGANQTKPLA